MVTAQSMHYYSVSANLRIHILLAVSYFNRQRLCAKSAAKLRQKNETAKCRLIFNVVFYPALCSSLCRVCRKIMYIQYRQRLTDLINSNSFYVLSTSFLRLFYVIGSIGRQSVYSVCSGQIMRAVCLYQKIVVTLRTF